jgi:hypothetical protein
MVCRHVSAKWRSFKFSLAAPVSRTDALKRVSAPPWSSLLRALWVSAGRAAVARALPLYFAVLIGASVLFEGSGVRPADVVQATGKSLGQRLLLYLVWTLVSLPALRALLATPASFFLRTLPVARWRMWTVWGAALLLAELPWAYLWLRGGGLGTGLAAIAGALGAGTLALTRLEQRSERSAALALALALCAPPFWPLLLAVSAPAAALGAQRVWLRAPEPRASSGNGRIAGGPLRALAVSHTLVLWRQARAQLSRAGALLLLALAAGYFGVKNTRPVSTAELLGLCSALLAPALILGGASMCGPLLRSEAQLRWLLDVCGMPARSRWLARLAPLALLLLGLALLHGIALAMLLRLPAPVTALLALLEALAALLLSSLLLEVARWALRGDGSDSGRLLLGVGSLLLGATLSLARWGATALIGWSALASLAPCWYAAQKRSTPHPVRS